MARPSTPWLLYALSSGFCAALSKPSPNPPTQPNLPKLTKEPPADGVFAKLTTTSLTTSWSTSLAHLFSSSEPSFVVQGLLRGFFFGMNLLFNAVMWGLFTRALTLASSTVRVSVINTSANFALSAVLGWMVFGEGLPGLWWVGAAMLVAGSVIIGRRNESKEVGAVGSTVKERAVVLDEGVRGFSDEHDVPVATARHGTADAGGVYSHTAESAAKLLRQRGSHSRDDL